MAEIKNIQLKDTINDVLTNLYPRTLVDDVITLNDDGSVKETLTELLNKKANADDIKPEGLVSKLTSSDSSVDIALNDDKTAIDLKVKSDGIIVKDIDENHIISVNKDGKIVDTGYFFTEI